MSLTAFPITAAAGSPPPFDPDALAFVTPQTREEVLEVIREKSTRDGRYSCHTFTKSDGTILRLNVRNVGHVQ